MLYIYFKKLKLNVYFNNAKNPMDLIYIFQLQNPSVHIQGGHYFFLITLENLMPFKSVVC